MLNNNLLFHVRHRFHSMFTVDVCGDGEENGIGLDSQSGKVQADRPAVEPWATHLLSSLPDLWISYVPKFYHLPQARVSHRVINDIRRLQLLMKVDNHHARGI